MIDFKDIDTKIRASQRKHDSLTRIITSALSKGLDVDQIYQTSKNVYDVNLNILGRNVYEDIRSDVGDILTNLRSALNYSVRSHLCGKYKRDDFIIRKNKSDFDERMLEYRKYNCLDPKIINYLEKSARPYQESQGGNKYLEFIASNNIDKHTRLIKLKQKGGANLSFTVGTNSFTNCNFGADGMSAQAAEISSSLPLKNIDSDILEYEIVVAEINNSLNEQPILSALEETIFETKKIAQDFQSF